MIEIGEIEQKYNIDLKKLARDPYEVPHVKVAQFKCSVGKFSLPCVNGQCPFGYMIHECMKFAKFVDPEMPAWIVALIELRKRAIGSRQ